MPEEISFSHIVIRDVGDIDVEQSVVIKIAPIGVHSLFGVKADGGLGLVRESAVAVIYIKSISAKIIGYIQVLPAIVIGVSVTKVKRPAGSVNADAICYLSERAITVVMKNNDSAAIVGVFKTLRKKPRRTGMENIDRLEVASNEKIDIAVIVIVKGDGLDGVHITVKARLFGYVAKLSIAKVLVKNAVTETDYEEVRQAVIVIVEPQRSG